MSDLHTAERERFEAWAKQEGWPFHWEDDMDNFHDSCWLAWQARAALAPAVPTGWQLVPVEPTAEMLAADMAAALCHNQKIAGRQMEVADMLAGIRACWEAMLAAAPSAKEPTCR